MDIIIKTNMKKLRFIHALALGLAVLGLASCDSKDEPKNPAVDPSANGIMILNQGSYEKNNAGISYIKDNDGEISLISDYFFEKNNSRLGDNATDIAVYNGYIYVSLTGSNCIYKLDKTGTIQSKVLFHTDKDLQGGVRYMAFKDNYIYASFYGGIVAKISIDNLNVESKLKTPGANLEGIAEVNGSIYVADSYESVYDATTGKSDTKYNDRLYIIDPKTFTVAGSVKVAVNPNKLMAYDGKLFLISWGNYADKGYSFQMIEPSAGNKVTELGTATDMGIGNGKVYLLNSVTDWTTWTSTNTWFTYDIESKTMNQTSFMKNAPENLATDHISMITVDSKSGDIYIGTTRYTLGNGQIYGFSKDGTMKINSDCGGQNPIGAVFM